MNVSPLFAFVPWISVIVCPTRAQNGGRELRFPAYYFFAEKRLVNHTIISFPVKDLDECEYRCYLNANCVSLNIKNRDPNSGTHICELNNSTHLEHGGYLEDNKLFYYRGAENKCGKNAQGCKNNSTCQSGFTQKGYKCSCTTGFEGEHCENDVNECDSGSHKCHVNATCKNTYGGYNCSCKVGYSGDGHNCTDIDECATGRHTCGDKPNSVCRNTEGSFKCPCAFGYVSNGNGKKCKVDVCNKYQNLTDAERKHDYVTVKPAQCDNNLRGWYRFQGAAGTKMVTECPLVKRCDANFPAWLSEEHPTVADGTVRRKVYINKFGNCWAKLLFIQVKNCGLYYIYQLRDPGVCETRYCGTD